MSSTHAELAMQGEVPLPADVDEMESQSLVPAFTDTQEPSRWPRARVPLVLGIATLLLGAMALVWGPRPPSTTASSADVDGEAMELSEWAGGPVPVRIAKDDRRRKAPHQICNKPEPTNVFKSTGHQCQHALFADRADGSVIAVNVIIKPKDLAFLNNDPKGLEYVPCDVTVNYHQPDETRIVNGRCRYKGSTGSFMGCTDKDGQATTGIKDCRKLSLKVKVNKGINDEDSEVVYPKAVSGKKPSKVIGLKEIQLQGMMHDDSLLRNHLGYSILRHLDIKASCSVAANVYINGRYDGVSDMTESVDDMFTKNRFSDDYYRGEGTLWKEMWPVSPDQSYYKNVQPIPGFANQEIAEEGKGGPYYDLFADFYREARDCFGQGLKCTKSKASNILDKYVWADSFIDGILGMTLAANSDQVNIIHHNFYFYVKCLHSKSNCKFSYVSWDYNQVLYDITASPIPGYEVALPWYTILTKSQRAKLCPYPVPSNSSNLNTKRFNHMTCDPVGYIMGMAWKDRFLAKVRDVDPAKLVRKAEEEVATWSKGVASSVNCDAQNGGWPLSAKDQEKASQPLVPMYKDVLGFWKAVEAGTLKEWPSPTFADFPQQTTSCIFDGFQVAQYLGQAGVAIAEGVRDCPHAEYGRNGVPACTSDISNVLASFGYVSSFLSSILAECPIRDSMGFAQRGIGKNPYNQPAQAECAAESSRLIAGLASVSAGASGLSEMCVPGAARANRGMRPAPARRMVSVGFKKSRPTEVASCSFDAIGAMAYLARAGIVIDRAVDQCSKFYGNAARCSTNVNAVLESLSYVAMFLANSVAQCAEEAHFPIDEAFQATCAADISQVVGALTSVASGGSGMATSCGKHWPRDKPYNVAHFESKRHLSDEELAKDLEASKAAWRDVAKGDRRKLKQWVEKHISDERPIQFG